MTSSEPITRTSSCFADPALIAEDNAATESQRRTDALGALVSLIQRSRPAWHALGACRGSSLDFTNTSPKNVAACLQLCGGCNARADCLAWALEIDDRCAVLGGMDPAARRRLARNRNATDKTAP
jgi:hypothetical protein